MSGNRDGRRVGRRGLLGSALALGGAAGVGALRPAGAQQPPPEALESPPTQMLERRVHSAAPLIAEAPVNQIQGLLVPNRVHFVRSHFNIPRLDGDRWLLRIEGAVRAPLTVTLTALKSFPSRTLTCFIECSGNGRSLFRPAATGTAWGNGGMSVAQWTGVPLATLLDAAGLSPRAVDIVAEGGDSGRVYSAIPREKALDPDTLVAYAQNGESLTYENGFPVRLVAPGWGGIRSIKWLQRIEATEEPFQGYYNDRTYVYETPGLPKKPVQALGVKSFITQPQTGESLRGIGPMLLTGFAHSGLGRVVAVEVSINGAAWARAELLEPVERWAWVRWRYVWDAPDFGEATLRSRAIDAAGNVQPETVPWNRYGYGNNSIQSVTVQVHS